MKSIKVSLSIFMVGLCVATQAIAFEEEDAVPLTIAAQSEGQNIGKIGIKLNGKIVEIRTEISNTKSFAQIIGFTAYTPFFDQLGVAEDHADKTFSDLTLSFNTKPLKPRVYRRGFFLGEDITKILRKARLAPLPEKNISSKKINYRDLSLEDWQGYLAYSWVHELAPQSNNVSVISYRALPQFGLDDISSDRFSYAILRHCGKPEEVRDHLKKINPSLKYIQFERYELPIKFLRSHKFMLEVKQHPSKKGDLLPLVSLSCGISKRSGDILNFSGEVAEQDNVLSVFIISKFPGSIVKESQ